MVKPATAALDWEYIVTVTFWELSLPEGPMAILPL